MLQLVTKSNSLGIKQKEKWITIGENDVPAHMDIDSKFIKSREFMREQKLERISFSIQFYDEKGGCILAAFFTKMYDENKNPNLQRQKIYDDLCLKFGSKIKF